MTDRSDQEHRTSGDRRVARPVAAQARLPVQFSAHTLLELAGALGERLLRQLPLTLRFVSSRSHSASSFNVDSTCFRPREIAFRAFRCPI